MIENIGIDTIGLGNMVMRKMVTGRDDIGQGEMTRMATEAIDLIVRDGRDLQTWGVKMRSGATSLAVGGHARLTLTRTTIARSTDPGERILIQRMSAHGDAASGTRIREDQKMTGRCQGNLTDGHNATRS